MVYTIQEKHLVYKIVICKQDRMVVIGGFTSVYLAELYAQENNLKHYTIQQEK
jgi:hypothetical protein